jgi:hypothetical protein
VNFCLLKTRNTRNNIHLFWLFTSFLSWHSNQTLRYLKGFSDICNIFSKNIFFSLWYIVMLLSCSFIRNNVNSLVINKIYKLNQTFANTNTWQLQVLRRFTGWLDTLAMPWDFGLVCFCILKVFLTKFKNFLFFY